MSVINRWSLLVLWVVCQAVAAQADAPEIDASFDRPEVFEGDSAVLRIEVVNAQVEDQPDFSPLTADFEIGQTGTNSSMSIVNGRKEYRTEWTVLLEPRRSGLIQVPPVRVGDLQTPPLTLAVKPRPKGSGPQGRDVFLEVEARPERPFVQEQVRYVIRLYHAPSIMEGSLGEPAAVDAVVERLGEDSDYRTVVDGKSYRVIERRYAIFPERSGSLELPEIRFQGRVADRSTGASGFNSLFSRGRLVSVKSEPISLEVQPRPPGYIGDHWLPASSLEVQEVWPNGDPEFRVGEPVTWAVILQARGLLSAQLPAFKLDAPEGAKVYPDQPSTQSRTDGTWVTGTREDRFAIVPVQPGTLELPELRIPWWDTSQDRMREAVIPARRFEVLPAVGEAVQPPSTPAQAPPRVGATAAAPFIAAGDGPTARGPGWRELALALAALWLLTVVAWLRARRGHLAVDAGSTPAPVGATDTDPDLRRACRADDAPAAARAALAEARRQGVFVSSLGDLASRVADPEQAHAIRELDRVLYGTEADDWRGQALLACCRRGLALSPPPPSVRNELIPPLYRRH